MPLPLLPLVIASLVAAAYHQTSKSPKSVPKGTLTPERQMIFHTAMNEMREPESLRKLATVYRDQGLPAHADQLEKRAKLRELPDDVKKARREAYRKAMTSQNPDGIRQVARVFESTGATGAAEKLREYADGLPPLASTADKSVTAIPVTPAPMPPPAVHGEPYGSDGDKDLDPNDADIDPATLTESEPVADPTDEEDEEEEEEEPTTGEE